MLVGILSDTHGYYHPVLDEVLAGADLILHAGDVGDPQILDRLAMHAPVKAVWGNIDGSEIRSRSTEHVHLTADGLRFRMTHIAGHPARWQRGMGLTLKTDPPDIFVCGHSHVLRIERVPALGNMLYINPGAAGRQGLHREKTCVRLHTQGAKAIAVDIVSLDKSPASVQ